MKWNFCTNNHDLSLSTPFCQLLTGYRHSKPILAFTLQFKSSQSLTNNSRPFQLQFLPNLLLQTRQHNHLHDLTPWLLHSENDVALLELSRVIPSSSSSYKVLQPI